MAMLQHSLIIIIILAGELIALTCASNNQCHEATKAIRIFDTFQQYQGNSLPFDPKQAGSQGNSIAFKMSTIKKLEKNTFVAKDSASIARINLTGKQIQVIDAGAFISLDCLQILQLNKNNLSTLDYMTFNGISTSLIELDLSENRLEMVSDSIFNKMNGLKTLNLAHNQISALELLAFGNLTNLEDLNLASNKLKKLPYDLFESTGKLQKLNLAFNKIADFPIERLNGLSNLRDLNLAANFMPSFDTAYNYSFSNLNALNLSMNILTYLNCVALPQHLPKLSLIDLNWNAFDCEVLIPIVRQLKDLKVKIFNPNLVGNATEGVICGTGGASYVKSTTSLPPTTTTIAKVSPASSSYEFNEYTMVKFRKLERGNDEILESLREVQDMCILLLILFGLLAAYLFFIKIGCYMHLCNFLRGGNAEIYRDNNDVETFRLLHR